MITIDVKNVFDDLMQNIRQMFKEELENATSFTQPNDEEILYSLEQVAKILGVSPKTMYSLNSRNEIAYCKRVNKCFYLKKDLLDYIQQGRVRTKAEIELEATNSLLGTKKKS